MRHSYSPWVLGLLSAALIGCVAGSEGPRGPGGPTDPEPGLTADLFAGPVTVPGQIRVDSILEMTIGVRNGGTRPVDPGWVIRVFLSTDRLIEPSDIQIDQFAVSRVLEPGAADEYLRHKKLLAGTPLGPYFVGSILDVTGAVAETSEANNTLQVPASTVIIAKGGPPPGDN